MSEENRTADANLHALHAERAALRLAAQTAGIVVGQNGDTYHAALNGAEATGATPGAALVALCVRLQQSAEAWEDIARDEAKKHGEALAIVKRLRDEESAELESARAYADEVEQERAELRDRALGILRAARQLVGAWRKERAWRSSTQAQGWVWDDETE